MNILVIGCGVSGLTTGLCLLQAGHTVSIWAKDLPPRTTSNVAAAFWTPHQVHPIEKVTAWGKVAFDRFKALQGEQGTGILMTHIVRYAATPIQDPGWVAAVDHFRHALPEELPCEYPHGYLFEAPVIDTHLYLHYLMQTFQSQGGYIQQRTVTDLAEACAQSTLVVNCSGLGARELVNDHDLHAARGQVVRIKHNGFRRVLDHEDSSGNLTYIVPRIHDIVLGGTYEEDNPSLLPNPHQTQSILNRCAKLAPEFAATTPQDILSVVCGLRPVRSVVRVEVERLTPNHTLIHNYGHGGAGITLSWGCATEVVELVAQLDI